MAVAVTTPIEGVSRPPVPYGRRIELPRRGTTFVREMSGPRNAPTLLLLHGWVASGGLNWYQVFEPLARHFRVVAVDMRGHARGLRTRSVFRLADCADDAADTLVQLDTGPVIAVGYSMGGPIAQLLWRRHRDLVDGMVLCATSAGFFPERRPRIAFQASMLAWVAAARAGARTGALRGLPLVPVPQGGMPMWAAAEMRRHDWRMIIEAGHSISTYNARRWIGEVDVPTSIVCTNDDRGVPPDLQLATADAIPGATVHTFNDGHFACANPGFAEPLLRACSDVASRRALSV
jgi:pimeloyl-ACP methyl ester carboxylesterase